MNILVAGDDVEVHTKDSFRRSPLCYAAVYGREAAVKLL